VTPIDVDCREVVDKITRSWAHLQPNVRQAILALVDSSLSEGPV
jgi:hypothetical protein